MTEDRQPSPGLRRLLETKLDTYEKLELVVVLSQQHDGTEATATDLARELQVGDDVLRRLATDLSRTSLVSFIDDKLRLTATPAEVPFVAEAAQLYESDRGKVINLLSTIAMDRIRGMAARSFADAFTLRKKKDDSDG